MYVTQKNVHSTWPSFIFDLDLDTLTSIKQTVFSVWTCFYFWRHMFFVLFGLIP